MTIELIIEHDGTLYYPAVLDGLTWQTDRYGSPGELNCTVMNDSVLQFRNGDSIQLLVDGTPLFYGFIFQYKPKKTVLLILKPTTSCGILRIRKLTSIPIRPQANSCR